MYILVTSNCSKSGIQASFHQYYLFLFTLLINRGISSVAGAVVCGGEGLPGKVWIKFIVNTFV